MKKLLSIVAIVALGILGLTQCRRTPLAPHAGSTIEITGNTDAEFAKALESKARGRPLQGQGTVTKVLRDDTQGSRHQRFIVKLQSGQTLLVAHNIDIAPKIKSLKVGDTVAFKGEYEWSPQGGVIHWTHHDPGARHPAGCLVHDGKTYQ